MTTPLQQAQANADAVAAYLKTLTPPAGPSGFTPPPVPTGATLKIFDDFTATTINNTIWGSAGQAVNAEGGIWLSSHRVLTPSVVNLQAYQDPSGIAASGNAKIIAAGPTVDNWVAAQFGTLSSEPFLPGTRVLLAMRADSLPGLTALALMTGINTWPPEIDFVEINAPLTLNSATLHYGSAPPNPPGFYPYYQVACDLTKWGVWGVEWTDTTINFLVQTTPTGPLTVWKSVPNPDANTSDTHSFAQAMKLEMQYQTNDALYNSGTPAYPANSPLITSASPMQMQIDWIQICTGLA